MSLIKPVDQLKSAVWIGSDYSGVPTIVRRFSLDELGPSELIITGLGYFEASINGKPVFFDKYQPVASDYEKREFKKISYPCKDKFTHRIYVCKYDVSNLLNIGDNILEVTLGDGWYRQNERNAEGDMGFGNVLKTIFSIFVNGTPVVVSDGSETWKKSEILYSNLFIGEIHDRNLKDETEFPVKVISSPDSLLCEQIGVPDRVIKTVKPKMIGTVHGFSIWDVGENISGIVRVTKRNGKVTLRYAENLNEDGSLDFSSTGSGYTCNSGKPQIMTDTYIGEGVFEPRFVWHAFRYFDIDGDVDSVEVDVIHSDVSVTSDFSSSSEGLNFLYNAFIRTQLNNMHGSFPSDCPHRERLGYTGDGQICADAGMMLLDSREFYKKWIIDILDCQSVDTGHVQHTAPFQGGGGGPGGWGCAIIIVPYYYYRNYGDLELIKLCYEPMRRWVDYLIDHSENGLVVREEEGGWCLGDWATLTEEKAPIPLVNTYFFIRSLRMLSEMSEALGYFEHIPRYRKLDDEMCKAIFETYFDGKNFVDERLGSNAFAVDLGIAPIGVEKTVSDYYDSLCCMDAGFLGTDVVLRVLFENGYEDTALSLLESEIEGSFLYMKRHGATTIWENWNGESSHDHPMFGASARYLFSYILGITYRNAGWNDIVICPRVPKGLSYVKGSIKTIKGRISVEIEQKNSDIIFRIILPENSDAEFIFENTRLTLCNGEHKISLIRSV